jgi:hypothetical protein
MIEPKSLVGQFLGTSGGVVQTELMRQVIDNPAAPLVPGIGGYGQASSLVSLISGIITLGAGIYGSTKKNGGVARLPDWLVLALIGHGTAATETGIMSGMFPKISVTNTLDMGAAQYIPPAGAQSIQPMGADMSMLNNMSAELNRLQTENMQLKSMQVGSMQVGTFPAIIPEGTVTEKQLRYGFMEPTPQEYIAPGQPTKAARELGFMDRSQMTRGRNPLVKVQGIASRSGFLG